MRRLLLCILFVLWTWPASGAPMHTDFAMIRKDAVTIVIGTVRVAPTGDITIDVDKVVRGTAGIGTMKVKPSPDGHISIADERVVGFLTAANELRWIGRKAAGGTIETGVIQLQGFFDFNAHIVSPGMMTLTQLGSILATGTLSQTLGVTLAFPDGKGAQKPSSKKFTIAYDAITRKAAAPGFTAACLDLGSVYGMEWGRLEVSFNDTCPRKGNDRRSLRLEGKPTGVDAAGNMQFELVPSGPVLTEPEYDVFVADGTLLDVVRIVKLALPDGTAWSWQIDKGLADPSGKLRQPGGMSSSYEQTGGGASTTTEAWEFGDAKVVLGAATYAGGNNFSLLSAIDAGTFTKCTLLRKGLAPVTCTAKQGAPLLVR